MRAEAATEVTGRWAFPVEGVPTFLVCTPKYLASFVRGPVINEEALFESIRYLVLDEVYLMFNFVCGHETEFLTLATIR